MHSWLAIYFILGVGKRVTLRTKVRSWHSSTKGMGDLQPAQITGQTSQWFLHCYRVGSTSREMCIILSLARSFMAPETKDCCFWKENTSICGCTPEVMLQLLSTQNFAFMSHFLLMSQNQISPGYQQYQTMLVIWNRLQNPSYQIFLKHFLSHSSKEDIR